MKKIVIALLFSVVHCLTSVAQIGTWKNYLAYHDVQQIQAAGNDQLFVLASNSLYQYNKNDQSIVTYDKVNGLSDTYITNIRWCPQAKQLVAVYGNTNIDLIDTNGNITNISDIYTKIITGEKSINSIHISGQYAYLACGFGIVKLNVQRAEISESYMLGFPVTAVTTDNSFIYAQTASDVWKAPLNSNLIDKSNWTQTTAYPSFGEDTSDYDDNIDLVNTLKPVGPKYNRFYFLCFSDNTLYSCGGLYHPLREMNYPGIIQIYKDNDWTIFQDRLDTITKHMYVDIDCMDIDPFDKSHIFAAGKVGLYEFRNSKFIKEYTTDNSMLTSTFPEDDNRNYVIVNALKYDKSGNLWMIQSLNDENKLLMLDSNGTWTKKDNSNIGFIGDGKGMFFDSNNYLWFVNNHGNTPALYRYDTSNSQALAFTKFINQDGSEVTIAGDGGVRCAAEDLEGNIWIGTSAGPLMLEKGQITNSDYYFTQVKVPRNDGTNYADYLLAGIDITCMAIDGGGRKWFGTNTNGVYLISADNMTQLQHFTTDNSPLLSNAIQSVTINPSTGEVFFGTENGLCSYISDATQTNAEMTEDNVWAYPNPVTPDYTGPITITGLTYNADVKILSSNGALIAEGRSNGGMFTWNGCDRNGNRVASGIYMVATAKNDGSKGVVCKIAIVR